MRCLKRTGNDVTLKHRRHAPRSSGNGFGGTRCFDKHDAGGVPDLRPYLLAIRTKRRHAAGDILKRPSQRAFIHPSGHLSQPTRAFQHVSVAERRPHVKMLSHPTATSTPRSCSKPTGGMLRPIGTLEIMATPASASISPFRWLAASGYRRVRMHG